MMEEQVRTDSAAAAVQALTGLLPVVVAAEHVEQLEEVVHTPGVPVLVARSELPTSQHRMHLHCILKTMFKSLSIT
jgi:hypothetical protein